MEMMTILEKRATVQHQDKKAIDDDARVWPYDHSNCMTPGQNHVAVWDGAAEIARNLLRQLEFDEIAHR